MTDGIGRDRRSEPVATLTIAGRTDQPDLEAVTAALYSLYSEASHKVEFRAVSLGDDVQIVFEIYEI